MSADVNGSRIIDQPRKIKLVSPLTGTVTIIFMIVGLLLPIVIIAIKVVVNQRIESKRDVEKLTTIPIIGEVSYSKKGELYPIVTLEGSKNFISEQFRGIRSNLSYLGLSTEKKVILVTSFMSGEGKSFIALNLGNILAQAGKKVVVIEFDLRKPKISSRLGVSNDSGLSEYVANDLHPSKIIKPLLEYSNLFFINSGPIPPNPAEMVLSSKIGELINYLRSEFDYIIMDTAPIGIVSDNNIHYET
jgi:capsular exopolysaccharide synthesis family protein